MYIIPYGHMKDIYNMCKISIHIIHKIVKCAYIAIFVLSINISIT